MLAFSQWRMFRAGADLDEAGDKPLGLYGLEKGQLDLSVPISSDEMVVLHRGQPGLWIGESALLAETVRGMSVKAHEESLVLFIPAAPLLRHLEETPHDWRYFFRLSHNNVMLTLQVFAETIALTPKARFARMLLRMASPDGVADATQTELGAMAGMSRAAFRRSFSELIESGVVKPEYGAVRILDKGALQRVVNAE